MFYLSTSPIDYFTSLPSHRSHSSKAQAESETRNQEKNSCSWDSQLERLKKRMKEHQVDHKGKTHSVTQFEAKTLFYSASLSKNTLCLWMPDSLAHCTCVFGNDWMADLYKTTKIYSETDTCHTVRCVTESVWEKVGRDLDPPLATHQAN